MARVVAALIRHGEYQQQAETPSSHQPYALTASGKAEVLGQAERFADLIQRKTWQVADRVDSSNMLRAWQTAMIFVESLYQHAMPSALIDSYDALAERSVGAVANLTVAQIEKLIVEDPRYQEAPPDWKSNSDYCLPFQGAESLMQAGARVAEHLQSQMNKLLTTAEADTVKLFVGHGAAFRHAAYHLGILRYEQLTQLSMHYAQPVFIEYSGEESWRHIGGDWKIRHTDDRLD